MIGKPLVSVVTVCYNEEKSIKRVLESVLCQRYDNFEYIIKDGGSTDRTNEIIECYKKKFKKRGIPFKYVSKKDGGIYDAMNKAVSLCQGEWVQFMNGDDRFYNQYVLSNVFSGKDYEGADILYGDALEQEFGQYYYYPKRMKEIESRMPFSHQSSFVRRKVLETYPFHTSYKIGSDYDFLLTAYKAGLSFQDVNCIVSVVAKEGVSTVNLYDTFVESMEIRKKHGIFLMTDKEYKRALIFVRLKQIGMDYFPKWLKFSIRKVQRIMRGQQRQVKKKKSRKKSLFCRKIEEIGSVLYRSLVFPFVRIGIEKKTKSVMRQGSYINDGTILKGKNYIGKNVYLSNVELGFGSYVSDKGILKNTKIGKYTSIGPEVQTVLGGHPSHTIAAVHPAFFSKGTDLGFTYQKETIFQEFDYIDKEKNIQVLIGNDVWIGSGTKILQGVTIGDGAIIGACSLVTKDVPPYEIYGGVPAKKIKDRFGDTEKKGLKRLQWWNKGEPWILAHVREFKDVKELLLKNGQ
ncbi:glycosyltransferase [bacterium 1XD42-8]|jgi:acetyltransferase-like isoleucine patch superfamily enzyme|nr:glycosyltransferase [bacterium 1XD42-8]